MSPFSLIIRFHRWHWRVAARGTGRLVFVGAFGLGVSLDDPLLIGPTLDGLFPLAHFLGDAIGMLAIVYAAVGAYGLYVREPW